MPNISTVSAVINGQTYNLTLDSTSGKYKATITAPSKSSYNEPGHYYDVKVTAEDEYGNTASAAILRTPRWENRCSCVSRRRPSPSLP